MIHVSFVVPTHRRPEALRSTLEAPCCSLTIRTADYEVVVVDDGSGDDTRDVVGGRRRPEPARAYTEQPNCGVATARNRGAAAAEGELLIFLDDDMLVKPDHINVHLATRDPYGDCLVNGHWKFSDGRARR